MISCFFATLFLKLKAAFDNLPVEVTIDSADDDSCVYWIQQIPLNRHLQSGNILTQHAIMFHINQVCIDLGFDKLVKIKAEIEVLVIVTRPIVINL